MVENSFVKTCLRPLLNAAHGANFTEIKANISHAQDLINCLVVNVSAKRLPLFTLITSPIVPTLLAVAASIHSSNFNVGEAAPIITALGAKLPVALVGGCIGSDEDVTETNLRLKKQKDNFNKQIHHLIDEGDNALGAVQKVIGLPTEDDQDNQ